MIKKKSITHLNSLFYFHFKVFSSFRNSLSYEFYIFKIVLQLSIHVTVFMDLYSCHKIYNLCIHCFNFNIESQITYRDRLNEFFQTKKKLRKWKDKINQFFKIKIKLYALTFRKSRWKTWLRCINEI